MRDVAIQSARVGPGRSRGFTLIELMVTVIVLAVILAIAFPSFTGLLNSNRLSGAANELVAGFQVARSEALRRNEVVRLCRSDDGATCATGGAWPGWIVVNATNSLLQSGTFKAPLQVLPSANITGGSIAFRPDGFARNGATPLAGMLNAQIAICITTTRPDENARLVSISGGGRFSVQRLNQAGVCPAPGNL